MLRASPCMHPCTSMLGSDSPVSLMHPCPLPPLSFFRHSSWPFTLYSINQVIHKQRFSSARVCQPCMHPFACLLQTCVVLLCLEHTCPAPPAPPAHHHRPPTNIALPPPSPSTCLTTSEHGVSECSALEYSSLECCIATAAGIASPSHAITPYNAPYTQAQRSRERAGECERGRGSERQGQECGQNKTNCMAG
jgi:hypothetical protein